MCANPGMASRPISHSPGLVAGIIVVMSSGPTCGAAVTAPGGLLKNRCRDRLPLAVFFYINIEPIWE
jgi:hypothetical protein